MKKNNENKSIISTVFSEKELAELNFSEEEIAEIEEAELICQAADVAPSTEKELDAFYAKLEATFPPSEDVEGTFNKFMDLQKTDPKFFEQIVAVSALIDTVEEVQPAETQKVSLDEIKAVQTAQSDEAKQAKFARIDAMIKSIAANK